MSKLVKVKALVLYSRPLGEKDRLLTLFSLEQGKLSAVAPGARKVKSKLAAGVELFTCGNYLLHRGRSMFTVTQVEQVQGFQAIRRKIKLYASGMYFAELLEKTIEENEANPALFQLLLDAWLLLDEGKTEPMLLARFFELKLLDLLGYRPHLEDCTNCGNGNGNGPIFWSDGSGGIVCEKCCSAEHSTFALSRGTCALADGLLKMPPGRLANLRVRDEQHNELKRLIHSFLQYWIATGPIKSFAFLEDTY